MNWKKEQLKMQHSDQETNLENSSPLEGISGIGSHSKKVSGFSKLSKEEKIDYITEDFFNEIFFPLKNKVDLANLSFTNDLCIESTSAHPKLSGLCCCCNNAGFFNNHWDAFYFVIN